MNQMQHFFVNRTHELIPVEIINESHFKRTVKVLEGEQKDKVINVHPKGVAWGTMYPRIFSSPQKPSHLFVHKGRALVNTLELNEKSMALVPEEQEYRFQPFVSDIIDCIHAKENILLTGGTGVGKTTHIMQLAARINQPVLRINFNGETRMSDLIGKMSVVGGETHWVDGVLPTAMRHGYWILFDEIDFAEPAVLSLLHPVLENPSMLTLKENNGEVIKPHSNFRAFATANSIGAMSSRSGAYGGTNTMNEAFLDRWHVIMVNNLPEKEEVKVLRFEAPGLNASIAKKMVKFANLVRNQSLGDGAIYSGDNFSTRKLVNWAKKAALHRDAIVGAKKSWLDKMDASDQDSMMRALMTHFSARRRSSQKNGIKLLKGKKITSSTGKPRGRPAKALQLNGTTN